MTHFNLQRLRDKTGKKILTESETKSVYSFLTNKLTPTGKRRELESRCPLQHILYWDVETSIESCKKHIAVKNGRNKSKSKEVLKNLERIKENTK